MEQILNLEGRKKWCSLIENARKVLCVGHVNPDGDALGSTLMMMKWLQRKGKEAHVVMPNHYPDFLAAVPGASEIVTYDVNPGRVEELVHEADLIICCDHGNRERTRDLAPVLEKNLCARIMIDHHLGPEDYCDLVLSRPEMCATC